MKYVKDELSILTSGLTHKTLSQYGIETKLQYLGQWAQRDVERQEMLKALADPNLDSTRKQAIKNEYNYKWRKTLFSCPRCWLLPGLCVCNQMATFQAKTKVVIHVHHQEWGKCSNTGCIVPISVPGSEMLLSGLDAHDRRMDEILHDPEYTTAILWPGADAMLPSQLQEVAKQQTGGRIAVVALDATWGNARRMQNFYPKGVLYVGLPAESVLQEAQLSLLRPVRCYRGDSAENGRVSTLEAVAALLMELEGDADLHRGLLQNLRIKVDAMRIQKNREPVYDTRDDWKAGGKKGKEAAKYVDEDGLDELDEAEEQQEHQVLAA